MSKDLTQKLNGSLEDKVDRLIVAVQSMDARIESMDARIESMDARIQSMDARIQSMDARIQSMDARIQSMDARIQSMDARIESMDARIQSMDARIQSLESRVESVESRLKNVEERLGSLETKVEDRLKETRPMWELVQAQLQDLRESHERLRAEMEKGFRIIDRRLEIQPIELSRLYGYQRDLDEWVEKVEKRLK